MESRSRKRYGLLLICLVLMIGCAPLTHTKDHSHVYRNDHPLMQRIAILEAQMRELEDFGLMDEAAAVGAATKKYGRDCRISTDCVKSLDTITGYADKDVAEVYDDDDDEIQFYRYNSSDSQSESDPTVIIPNDISRPTTGSWLQLQIKAASFTSTAADGEHLVDPSNTSSLPASPADGAISSRDDTGCAYIADESQNWWPFKTNWYEEYTTGATLPYDAHCGGTATNYGATGAIQLNLRKAVLGMEASFFVAAAQALRVNPDDADKFIGSGFTNGEYYWANGIGEYITIRAVQNGAGATDVDWAIVNIGGIWSQET